MSTFTGCRELSLSIVVSVVTLPKDVYLIVQDSLSEFMSNAPSDSDGDLPLAIWHYWRDCPRCVRHYVIPLAYGRLVIGSVFPAEVILSIERMSVH